MATNVQPTDTAHSSGSGSWRRAVQVLLAVVLLMASVAAQAVDKTPIAIVLLVVAVISVAPLAMPALDQ